jgi:hypothetical protein
LSFYNWLIKSKTTPDRTTMPHVFSSKTLKAKAKEKKKHDIRSRCWTCGGHPGDRCLCRSQEPWCPAAGSVCQFRAQALDPDGSSPADPCASDRSLTCGVLMYRETHQPRKLSRISHQANLTCGSMNKIKLNEKKEEN